MLGVEVMVFARRRLFPTSVGLIRGGYRGAAPRAAYMASANAHTFSAGKMHDRKSVSRF